MRNMLFIISMILVLTSSIYGQTPSTPLALAISDGAIRLFDDNGALLSVEPFDQNPGYSIYDPNKRIVYHFTGNSIYAIRIDDLEFQLIKEIPQPKNQCLKSRLSDNLQSVDDMRFTKEGKGLCITLRDKPAAEMTTEAIVFVPLGEGNPTANTIFGSPKQCGTKVVKVAPCVADTSYGFSAKKGSDAQFTISEATCEVGLQSGEKIKVGREDQASCALSIEGVSSTGRYIAVSVITGAGLTIQRRLYFIDTKEKKMIKNLKFDVGGETNIQWSNTKDAMIIDGNLVILDPQPKRIAVNRSLVFLK